MDLPIGCYGNESILLAPSEMVSVFYFTLFIIGHEEGSVQSSATDDTWTVGPSLLPPFHLLKERELPPWNIDQVTQTPVYNVYVKSAVFALNIRFNFTADTDSMLFQIAPPPSMNISTVAVLHLLIAIRIDSIGANSNGFKWLPNPIGPPFPAQRGTATEKKRPVAEPKGVGGCGTLWIPWLRGTGFGNVDIPPARKMNSGIQLILNWLEIRRGGASSSVHDTMQVSFNGRRIAEENDGMMNCASEAHQKLDFLPLVQFWLSSSLTDCLNWFWGPCRCTRSLHQPTD